LVAALYHWDGFQPALAPLQKLLDDEVRDPFVRRISIARLFLR
jgi:hypothetical protein